MFVLFRNIINEWWQQQQIQHNDANFINSSANDSDKQSSASCAWKYKARLSVARNMCHYPVVLWLKVLALKFMIKVPEFHRRRWRTAVGSWIKLPADSEASFQPTTSNQRTSWEAEKTLKNCALCYQPKLLKVGEILGCGAETIYQSRSVSFLHAFPTTMELNTFQSFIAKFPVSHFRDTTLKLYGVAAVSRQIYSILMWLMKKSSEWYYG